MKRDMSVMGTIAGVVVWTRRHIPTRSSSYVRVIPNDELCRKTQGVSVLPNTIPLCELHLFGNYGRMASEEYRRISTWRDRSPACRLRVLKL